MSNCKVHNVRFYKPVSEAIYCMAYEKTTKKLAIARADASLEIWNLHHAPFMERSLPSSVDHLSIEGMGWYKKRLFGVGLQGVLTEYDLRTLNRKYIASVTGEAAFCMDIHERNGQLAIGTEQGYINIFDASGEEVLFNKFLDKQEGRILCLKFDDSGNYIVSGSMDAVRVWDVQTGHALHRMTTGRSKDKGETVVWCLTVLDDLTIISGDSRGKLSFWDGKLGALIESYQSHRADVLSIAVSDDRKTLYCAGVDPNIVSYAKVNVKGENQKWIKSIQRKIHDHDVRALLLVENKMYSGGVDGYLACSYYPPKTLLKYPPFLQHPCVVISKKKRFILLKHAKHVELWSLGDVNSNEKGVCNGLLPLKKGPKKLLHLCRTVKDESGELAKEGIACCTISDDGSWLAYSTDRSLRIFRFRYVEGEEPTLVLVDNLPEEIGSAINLIFTPNSAQLIVALRLGGIQILNLQGDSVVLSQNLDTTTVLEDAVISMTISPCNKYLVIADCLSNIIICENKNSQWSRYCKLPKYSCIPTSIGIQPKRLLLVVAYADQKIIEYDISQKKFTQFSRNLDKMPLNKLPSKQFSIKNVTFDPRKPNVIILHDDSYIIVIDKEKKLPKPDSKIPKLDPALLSSDSNDSLQQRNVKHAIHTIKKYKHLVHLEWLDNDEMVAVEVNPASLMEHLPPCLKLNTFGTK